ncbi:thermonuclease family protein [Pseudomonas sp. ZM23]|uniref:Thermonuclease family protein n=1 Tax=Pseudomonas triclosanedens TaxID=2961893 RepID=A0ABY6ZZB2_9PSED|nr:thermonuclease family protein [Pseudomonas triclosanedens]MCP8462983.1 thermonuclease family protein [Pseudomonas triclosanedens]MCP8468603.1 thermonuclease family protein [Pseudomonas triclosanedens]MCP8475325.1 thermonuclease family protein [Pseudomonas triclosanedens]WAI50158.1 thermonuclease family protein [Pseudomonas triclosanedens]
MVFHGISKKASLVGAFFMAALFSLDASAASCPKPHSPEIVRVARVVDGDTLKLADGRSVRLIGVNAPELAHRGRSEEPFAVAAKRGLEQLVAANDDEVGLVSGRQGKDKYGRTLAHAYDAQGNNLESRLLAEGLGYLVAIAPNTELTACQQVAEREARSAGLGLWKRSPVQTPQQLHESGFALVRGRVEQVERNRGGIWIDFDGPLVLRIDFRSLDNFDADALRNLRGRQVEARGWVIDRAERGSVKPGQARWMLPLTDPAMMEVLP